MWIRTCASCICQSSTGEPKYQPSNRSEAPPWVIFVNSLAVSAWRERCFQGSEATTSNNHLGSPLSKGPFWKGSPVASGPTFPRSQTRERCNNGSFKPHWLEKVRQHQGWPPTKRHCFLAGCHSGPLITPRPNSNTLGCPIKMPVPKTNGPYASPENVHESLGSLEMSPELGRFPWIFQGSIVSWNRGSSGNSNGFEFVGPKNAEPPTCSYGFWVGKHFNPVGPRPRAKLPFNRKIGWDSSFRTNGLPSWAFFWLHSRQLAQQLIVWERYLRNQALKRMQIKVVSRDREASVLLRQQWIYICMLYRIVS